MTIPTNAGLAIQLPPVLETQTKVSFMHIPDNMLQYVIHQFGSHVKLCTELKYKTATNCCHPSYQSGGPIYDWMNVTYTHANTKETTLQPCRLAVAVVTKESQPYRLVVQCGVRKTGIKSVLHTEWECQMTLPLLNLVALTVHGLS
jgi:hypothetical protein